MKKVRIRRKNGHIIIKRKLEKSEQINLLELDILNKREIPPLCSVEVRDTVRKPVLTYRLPEYRSLASCFSEKVDFGRFCAVLHEIVKAIEACDAYAIRVGNLELRSDMIFLDNDRSGVFLIFWPITTLDEPPSVREELLRIGKEYPANESDLSFKDEYLELFNTRKKFSIFQFEEQLLTIWEKWMSMKSQQSLNASATAASSSLTLVEQESGQRISLYKFPFVIGRQPDLCNYSFPTDLQMSKTHFALVRQDNEIYIIDNNSRNGTLVNGERVTAGAIPKGQGRLALGLKQLHSGDVIKAGRKTFVCAF